jgi:hypothetical protein
MILIAGESANTRAATLRRAPDFASIPITIQSERRDALERMRSIQQAVQLIERKAGEHGPLKVQLGQVSLGVRDEPILYSSVARATGGRAQLHVFAPLGEGGSIYRAAEEIRRFLHDVSLPRDVSLGMGDVQLAIENPEQFRPEILQVIAASLGATREGLQLAGTFSVSGLEGPVIVRRIDDRTVELFIDYRLAYLETP